MHALATQYIASVETLDVDMRERLLKKMHLSLQCSLTYV
jgi:hypothetical protein